MVERLIDCGEYVTDTVTSLDWKIELSQKMTWYEAMGSHLHDEWRIPTLPELRSARQHFADFEGKDIDSVFWTSTGNISLYEGREDSYAWAIDFYDGTESDYHKDTLQRLLLVRPSKHPKTTQNQLSIALQKLEALNENVAILLYNTEEPCPCCTESLECIDSCTFETDCPDEWEAYRSSREIHTTALAIKKIINE